MSSGDQEKEQTAAAETTAEETSAFSWQELAENTRLPEQEAEDVLGTLIDELMNEYGLQDNMFALLVAYNGGPGNLRKWEKGTKYNNDPLLFIESIPSRETRVFVEKMISNFWIYRERLSQDTPSLDAVATGHAPIYLNLDDDTLKVADRGRY